MWQAYEVGIDFQKVRYLCDRYMSDKTVGEGNSECVPRESLAYFLIVSSYKGLAFVMKLMTLITSARCGSMREYLAIGTAVQVLVSSLIFLYYYYYYYYYYFLLADDDSELANECIANTKSSGG